MNKRSVNVYPLVLAALLTTLATVLHVMEGFLPVIPVPGAKLGLANIITVAAIIMLGPKYALAVAVSRVGLGFLLGAGANIVGFSMSFSGAIMSWLVMSLVWRFWENRISLVGISLAGAVVHNLAQLTVASQLLSHIGTYYLFPFLMLISIPTGILVGLTAGLLVKAMEKNKYRTRRQ